MRASFLTTDYSAYLKSFYRRRNKLSDTPYAVQHSALMEDCYAAHGAWTSALPKYGYEVQEIYANVPPLQHAWARENTFRAPSVGWVSAIALEQLAQWNPEILLVENLVTFSREFISAARKRCPNIRKVVGFCGSISYDVEALKSCDVVLSNLRSAVPNFRGQGINARYFPHAFNPSVLQKLPDRDPIDSHVIFVGGLVRAAGYHLLREKLLEAIVEALPLQIYTSQTELTPIRDFVQTGARRALYHSLQLGHALGISKERMERIPAIGRAVKWQHVPLSQINPILRARSRPALYGEEFYAAQRKSAVTLNIHGDNSLNEAINMRLFEVTGVGGCLLTDAKDNLGDFFELDREVVAYASAEECVEKARWLLEHPKEREAIALAGQKRTLANHTFHQRAVVLHDIISEHSVGRMST